MVFNTSNYGDLIITKYVNSKTVHVLFKETGFKTVTTISHIQNGSVKDKLKPSVCGVGVIGYETSRVDGVVLKEYALWLSMLHRCYGKKSQNCSYKDCSVSDNFKCYPYFKAWCNKQIGFNKEGFELDKDILIKGNKIYSEDTCCFVPKEINILLTRRNKARGRYPLGVSYHKNHKKFAANISVDGNQTYVGYFNTEGEAFNAYKHTKEAYIKELANKWKDQIDPRVYGALINYQVEITD